MKTRIVSSLLILFLLYLAGCAAQKSIALDPHFWQQQGRRVGVILATYPHAETTEAVTPMLNFSNVSPLAPNVSLFNDEMNYEPLRLADMKPLQKASSELDAQEFSRTQDLFVKGLKDRGFAAFKIDRNLSRKDLLKFDEVKEESYEKRDFRDLGKTYNADYLIVIELLEFGPYCHWIQAYNDHTAVEAHVRAELLDAKDNRILWKAHYRYQKPVKASCSNRDQISIVTEALQSLLSDAAVSVPRDFFSSNPQKYKTRNIPDTAALSRARP